jgi:hypothetical protein
MVWVGVAAVPIAALLIVFDATRPPRPAHGEAYASYPSSALEAVAGVSRQQRVARLSGVAAELSGRSEGSAAPKLTQFDSTDALLPGAAFEYVSMSRHRFVVHILDRQPLTDDILPANDRLMNIAPASTEKTITFVWGHWLYRAEIEDRGVEETVAFQKSL